MVGARRTGRLQLGRRPGFNHHFSSRFLFRRRRFGLFCRFFRCFFRFFCHLRKSDSLCRLRSCQCCIVTGQDVRITVQEELHPVLVRVRREDGVSVQAGCEGDASVLHRVGLPDRLERVVDVLPPAVRVLMMDRHVILHRDIASVPHTEVLDALTAQRGLFERDFSRLLDRPLDGMLQIFGRRNRGPHRRQQLDAEHHRQQERKQPGPKALFHNSDLLSFCIIIQTDSVRSQTGSAFPARRTRRPR